MVDGIEEASYCNLFLVQTHAELVGTSCTK